MAEETKNHTAHTLKNLYNRPVKQTWVDNGRSVYLDHSITQTKSPEQLAEKARIAELERTKQQEQAAQERAAADLAAFHDSKLQAWVKAGGTEKSFRDVWPAIEQRYLLGKIGLGE